MKTTPELTRKRPPVFGALSVLVPIIGGAISLYSYILALSFSGEAAMGAWMERMGMILVTIVSGWIFSAIALMRQERYEWLAYIGLFLSSSPIFYFFYEHLA